jgi:predicted nucleotide-binding protein
MAKRKTEPEPIGQPEVDEPTAIKLITAQVDKARVLLSSSMIDDKEYDKWQLLTPNLLEKAFGRNAPNVTKVTDAAKIFMYPMGADSAWWERHRRSSLTAQVPLLEGLIELLQTNLQIRGGGNLAASSDNVFGQNIFLVHGHNDAILHDVARFLEKLNLSVSILRELPNEGRTIIEKFEDHSDVGFAIVLLTPDDKGGSIDEKQENMRPRARQNVILEFGYFLGKIGRNRVCALFCEGIGIPSDYSGVLYVPIDRDGGWRLRLAKELVASGIKLDMNRAL